MKLRRDPTKWLKKKTKGFRGYPAGTVAFYGPDNQRASKVAVGIIPGEDRETTDLRRWFSESNDVRNDKAIGTEISEFLQSHGVRSVVMTDRIIGCPHEEGIDYPEGEECPLCPFWKGKDRWAGG
jgi:hypothetical protein